MSMSMSEKMCKFVGQNVVLEDDEGKKYEGKIVDYERPVENDEEEYAIYLTTVTGENWCLLEHEIVSLELRNNC